MRVDGLAITGDPTAPLRIEHLRDLERQARAFVRNPMQASGGNMFNFLADDFCFFSRLYRFSNLNLTHLCVIKFET